MALRLLVFSPEGSLASVCREVTLPGSTAVVGRQEGVDLVLPDLSVSRRHLVVRAVPGQAGWELEDLNSQRGTRLNGRALTPGVAVPLRPGDEVGAGDFRLVFGGEGLPGDRRPEDTRALASSLAQALLSSTEGAECCLLVENGPAAGTRLVIGRGTRLRLGRGRECELVIDDARVSRVHAVIHAIDGCLWLADAGSANGLRLDGRPVKDPEPLRDGCRLDLGRVRLRLVVGVQRRLDLVAVLDTGSKKRRPVWLPSLLLLLAALGFALAWWV
jgi:pSer/pThr/pTyr-binding forkhead associated (FHA) protein